MYSPIYDIPAIASMKIADDALKMAESISAMPVPRSGLVTALANMETMAMRFKTAFDPMLGRPVTRHVEPEPTPRHRWAADHGAGF